MRQTESQVLLTEDGSVMLGVIQQQGSNADSQKAPPESADHMEGAGKQGHGRGLFAFVSS